MRNPIRSISPGYTPVNTPVSNDLAVLRERILQTILLITSSLGSVGYLYWLLSAASGSHLINMIIFTLMLLLLWAITFSRSVPYLARSSAALLMLYIVTLFFGVISGLYGPGQMLLLAILLLTAILLGVRAFVASLLVGLATLFLYSTYTVKGWASVPPQWPMGASFNLEGWLINSLFLLAGTALAVVPLLVIVNQLHVRLQKYKASYAGLEKERDELEIRLTGRTADLERRLSQLRTAAEISRSISSVLDPDELLQQVVDLLASNVKLYYAGVFLLDDRGHYAILRAGSGDAGKAMIAEGHRLQVGGSSMIGWATAARQARIALDVGTEAVRFNNPHLPLTRSELALPILGKSKVLGALTIQSDQAGAFDENDILILQGIADSLAIAMENAQLFQQNQRDLEEIRALNKQYLQHAWSETNIRGDLQVTYHNPYNNSGSGSQSVQVPIIIREQPIGKVTLDTGGKQLSSEELAVVEAITTQIALALENARLLEQTTRRAERERKVLDITSKIRSTNDIDRMIQIAVEELQLALGAARAQVILNGKEDLEPPGGQLQKD
jgi:GAF domain-containing protein